MSAKPFSSMDKEQLAKLERIADDRIDTADIPEAPAENWRDAKRPALYRAMKQSVTIRLDADVLAWFKEHTPGGGYQTEINRVLRQYVGAKDRARAS